jgi:uncharacterized protein YbgA (DUF1722 family)/uncharacterized protein YbbK (DUF523 family)
MQPMTSLPDIPSLPLLVGISSCLLGEEVRYDGGHKHNPYITKTLGEYFEFRAFCPEVAIGLGIPRPPIRLVRSNEAVRVRGVQDPELDVTGALDAYGREVAGQLQGVSGYLFKRGSPSCGMERVKVYNEDTGMPVDASAGRFAAAIMQALPELPCEEEGRLMDPYLRENFIERVFIYHRWQCYLAAGLTPALLVDFHTRHKLIVLAHNEPVYRQLGRLVAEVGTVNLQALAHDYIGMLMKALKQLASPKTHSNVLMHIMGYYKKHLGEHDKQELLDLIDDYRNERVPLIVPMTMIQHYQRLYPNDYLASQYYLNPHPRELMLRNRI